MAWCVPTVSIMLSPPVELFRVWFSHVIQLAAQYRQHNLPDEQYVHCCVPGCHSLGLPPAPALGPLPLISIPAMGHD